MLSMDCPVQLNCGGCPTLGDDWKLSLLAKAAHVHSLLSNSNVEIAVGAPVRGASRLHYRNRTRMNVVEGRVVFFNKIKSDGCVVMRPDLWQATQVLVNLSESDPELFGEVDHLEVRVCDEPGMAGLSLVAVEDRRETEPYEQRISKALGAGWLVAFRTTKSQPEMRYRVLDDLELVVPIDSFVQVNSEVNRLLVKHVVDTIIDSRFRTFVDLYSGAGNFSLPLLASGLSGVAVESNESAISTLKTTASEVISTGSKEQKLRTLAGDVHDSLDSLEIAEVVICNPPRSGLSFNHAKIAELTSKMIIIVSCNPAALAVDTAELHNYGFAISSVKIFEMFPGTNHVEVVAVLHRIS